MRRVLVAALALLAAGCAPRARPAPAPLASRWQVQVSGLAAVGPYLDATLSNERFTRRFFFPASEACRALLASGQGVTYREIGPFGRLGDASGARCEPIGVASLREWRDAGPHRRAELPLPRVQAAFRPLHEGEALLLLRGRFPLALEIRWPVAMDSVAVLPALPACRKLLERHTATMEFHASGPEVFVLEAEGDRCPILGFAVPLEAE